MDSANRMALRLRACQTCGGDAYLDMWDSPEWRCLQCARQVVKESAVVLAMRRLDRKKAA